MSFYAEYFSASHDVTSLSQVDFAGTPVATDTVEALNQWYSHDPFWAGGSRDYFGARYSANLNIQTGGSYTFYLNSDDGSALYIDGERVINNDGLHGTMQQEVTMNLGAGVHEVEIRYFERTGEQTLRLEWGGPDSGGKRELLSGDQLTPGGHDGGDGGHDGGHGGTSGLQVEFFAIHHSVSSLSQIDFDATPVHVETAESLNNWRNNNPFWDGGRTDDTAARYSGDLNIQTGGSYTFYLNSDDGSALYIDGERVIGNDGLHGVREESVTLDLTAGAHSIEVLYFERGGWQTLALEWEGPDSGHTREVISGDSFSHGDGGHDGGDGGHDGGHGGTSGLQVEFFAIHHSVSSLSQIDFDATPVHVETAESLNNWRNNNPFWDGGRTDDTAARYSGDLNIQTGGSYTFYLNSDDGSALYIDGERVIGNDGLHGVREESVTLDLTAGAHSIEVLYFERGGWQTLALEWEGPDSGHTREVISGDSFSHSDGGHDGGDGGHDGGDGGHGDGGHSDSYIEPPADPTDIVAVNAYVAAVKALPDSHSHDQDGGMAQEHMAVLDLVPRSVATHIAITDGDWFDPATWHNGLIPGEGAQVLIPEGIAVNYDGESDASLFTVRVDGELGFATDTDTKILLDTMIITPTGRLEIGTEDNPVQPGVTTDIVIANNGDINTGWDPQLLSRGVISHGAVEIHGTEKSAFHKVDDAPMAGDTQITLGEIPEGWQVGDKIVVSGTHKQGWFWDNDVRQVIYHESEDEEVEIVAINGNQITIDRPLEYDHDTPRDDLKAYVSNMTRNITFSSEDGDQSALHHRGHVMFMHSDDVDVRYAGFEDLGRTDKSVPAFDVATLDHVQSDTNVKARYPFHFHKTGTEEQENPAMAIGNVVDGSPGWGFVHHSSHAYFTDNVAFDVFGAAFAAEDGDETGIWTHNIAIRSEGIGPGDWMVKQESDVARHDNGRTGDGFFFGGRLVEANDNVAVNTTHGYVWMHRSAPKNPLSDNLDQSEIAYGNETINPDRPVIQGFHNNEAFGTEYGLIVVKAGPHQNHDVRSIFDGFLNWETTAGIDVSYTSHYTFLNVDLLATQSTEPFVDPGRGFNVGSNVFDVVVNGITLEGFSTGVDLNQDFHFGQDGVDYDDIFIDVNMIDVIREYVGFDPAKHTLLTSGQLVDGRLEFIMTGDTTISEGETLYLDGTKIDSIGARDRQFAGDVHALEWHEHLAAMIANEGYYKTEDGRNVLLVEDVVADRATGELHKFSHVITLDMSDQRIQSSWSVNHWGGAKFNGTISLDDIAPTTQDDTASTRANQDILIDVLANDSHADGDTLFVDGMSTTPNGNVYVQDDGQLLYRPNPGFTGTDTFTYWAGDQDGDYTSATVTVDVWAL